MAPFSSNLLNALRYRWMFACSSRLRRLQTYATGMERPFTSHHGPNVSSLAQYQKAQLYVRLRFEIAQVANLRYRNGETSYVLSWPQRFLTCSVSKSTVGCSLAVQVFARCKPALPEGRGPLRPIMAPTFSHTLSTKKHSWMFACSSRLRTLQTCATGAHSLNRDYRSGPE